MERSEIKAEVKEQLKKLREKKDLTEHLILSQKKSADIFSNLSKNSLLLNK